LFVISIFEFGILYLILSCALHFPYSNTMYSYLLTALHPAKRCYTITGCGICIFLNNTSGSLYTRIVLRAFVFKTIVPQGTHLSFIREVRFRIPQKSPARVIFVVGVSRIHRVVIFAPVRARTPAHRRAARWLGIGLRCCERWRHSAMPLFAR
jgi:hypothetical protein